MSGHTVSAVPLYQLSFSCCIWPCFCGPQTSRGLMHISAAVVGDRRSVWHAEYLIIAKWSEWCLLWKCILSRSYCDVSPTRLWEKQPIYECITSKDLMHSVLFAMTKRQGDHCPDRLKDGECKVIYERTMLLTFKSFYTRHSVIGLELIHRPKELSWKFLGNNFCMRNRNSHPLFFHNHHMANISFYTTGLTSLLAQIYGA